MNINKQTLSEQIYQILRADIISQVIPCGSKLTLKVLKERFGVSSTPIREALARLTEEQLLSYYSNLGVSVVSLGKEDIHEIYQFMGELDSLAVRYASLYPDQQAVVGRLEENIRLMEACDLEDKAWAEYSDEFHLIFYEYCQNSRLFHSAEQMRSQMSILAYQYENHKEKQRVIVGEHKEIFHLFRDGKHEAAASLMKEHLLHSLVYAEEILGCTR